MYKNDVLSLLTRIIKILREVFFCVLYFFKHAQEFKKTKTKQMHYRSYNIIFKTMIKKKIFIVTITYVDWFF